MSESKKVRVAIIGVGNCASSLVQGVHFYRNTHEDDEVPLFAVLRTAPEQTPDQRNIAQQPDFAIGFDRVFAYQPANDHGFIIFQINHGFYRTF